VWSVGAGGLRRGATDRARSDSGLQFRAVLSPIDVAIVVAFLAICVAIGLRHRRSASRDLDAYFLAGRSLSGWRAGTSMAATQFAADTPLLVTGMIATSGVFSLWRLWIYALAFLVLGFLLAGPWRRARVLTDAELAELRYGGRAAVALRGVKAVYFGLIFNCTVMAMVLLAAARIAEPFLAWDRVLPAAVTAVAADAGGALGIGGDAVLSLVLILVVTTFYSTTGGLRAVVTTDAIQLVVALVASAIYAVVVVAAVGGLDALPVRLAELYGEAWAAETLAFTPDLARDAGAVTLGTIALQWLAQMNADGTGYLAQRTMACRDDREARRAAIVFVTIQVLIRSLLWLPIGLALLILFPAEGAMDAAAREGTFVQGIADHLPAGARGLMLAGLLAALASTLDTHLNWGSSYLTNDLYGGLVCRRWLRREPSGRALVRVARLGNLVILAGALAILGQLGSIQDAWHASLLLGAGMGAPLLLRWLWWRVTAVAELTAVVGASVAAPVLLATVDDEGTRMLLVTVLTFSTTVVLSWVGSRAPGPAPIAFYQRVHPPGLWGPVARACGEDPRAPMVALARGALAVLLGGLAVFAALVAVGTWLVGSPPPGVAPGRAAWIAGLLVVAVVAAALLRRQLRRERPS
jgi:solute:Na+ symporter, SSS family